MNASIVVPGFARPNTAFFSLDSLHCGRVEQETPLNEIGTIHALKGLMATYTRFSAIACDSQFVVPHVAIKRQTPPIMAVIILDYIATVPRQDSSGRGRLRFVNSGHYGTT